MLSGVGAFIACVTIFLILTSVYMAWRVYIKGKKRFEKGVKLQKNEVPQDAQALRAEKYQ
ncbi:MAG: hypothetical protein ACMG6E_10145 [Candidatus Roizmanbacteria bacterium]